MEKKLRRTLVLGAIVLGCLGLALTLFTHGGQDDTYITYWAAHVLGERGTIANHSGLPTEQSSSLALVVVLGALHFLTRLDVPLLGYLVGLICFALTLVQSARLARREGVPAPNLAALAIGTIPAFAYWATSGMETSLVVLSGLVIVERLSRPSASEGALDLTLTSASVLLFAASRPETPILAAALLVVSEGIRALRARFADVPSHRFLAGLGAIALLLLVRRLYFGHLVPNPALLKRHGFDVASGFRYLADGSVAGGYLAPILLLGAVGGSLFLALRSRNVPGRVPDPAPSDASWLTLALAGGYGAFIVLSGGDWMRGGRFVALAAPFCVVASILGMRRMRTAPLVVSTVALVHLVACYAFLRSGVPEGRPLWTASAAVAQARTKISGRYRSFELTNKVHVRDALLADSLVPLVGRLHEELGRPVTVMSGQAGLVAFEMAKAHYGNFRFLDLWNITDPSLLRCLGPKSFRFTIFGTGHDLGTILDGLAENGERCGLGGRPDVYFNERLRPPHQAALDRHDYVVVYRQTGTVRNSESRGPFDSENVADGHIAIRRDLAERLGLRRSPAFRWTLNPAD